MTETPRYSWTQPSCLPCWSKRSPGREPARVIHTEPETCVYCGHDTQSGIFVRIDPKLAPFPSRRKDDA